MFFFFSAFIRSILKYVPLFGKQIYVLIKGICYFCQYGNVLESCHYLVTYGCLLSGSLLFLPLMGISLDMCHYVVNIWKCCYRDFVISCHCWEYPGIRANIRSFVISCLYSKYFEYAPCGCALIRILLFFIIVEHIWKSMSLTAQHIDLCL